jgi:hypothetical protein
MAIFYSDVATAQLQGNNFPGQTGLLSGISALPSLQTNPLSEGPSEIVATYTWVGTEAANDIINWGIIPAGTAVDPWGHWQNGATAPATTLTVAVGDNDLGTVALNIGTGGLPLTNPTAVAAQPTGVVASTWVTGTTYVPGNVVLDPGDTPVNTTWTNIVGLTSATQPHSDTTKWVANSTRYSTSINVAAASAAVAFAPPAVATGFNPYFVGNDCWLQSKLLTCVTPVAGAISVIRVYLNANN